MGPLRVRRIQARRPRNDIHEAVVMTDRRMVFKRTRPNRPSAPAPATAESIAIRRFRHATRDMPATASPMSGNEWALMPVADPSSLDDAGSVGCGGISVCGAAGRVIAGCDGVGLNSTQPIVGKYTSGHA